MLYFNSNLGATLDTLLTRGGRDTPVKQADQRPDDTD